MKEILIVDDDDDIRSILERGFASEGFITTLAGCAGKALEHAGKSSPEAVLLDVMLPDRPGHDVCRALRDSGYPGPILFLSARDKVEDRAHGLSLGADDYIVKPFVFSELLARLHAHIIRRASLNERSARLVVGHLSLDMVTREARFGTALARLTQREAELLAILMRQVGRPISRGDLFDQLWATQGCSSLNVVDVYVGYLRIKLSEITRAGGPIVTTVRGRGFVLDLRAAALTN